MTRGVPPRGRNEQTLVMLRTLDVEVPDLSGDEAPVALVLNDPRDADAGKKVVRHHEGRFYVEAGTTFSEFEAAAFDSPFSHEGPRADLFGAFKWEANSLTGWPTSFPSFVRQDRSTFPGARPLALEMSNVKESDDRKGLPGRYEALALAGLRRYVFVDGVAWSEVGEPVFAVRLLDDVSGDDVEFEFSFSGHRFGGELGTHFFSLSDRQGAMELVGEHMEELRPDQIEEAFPTVEILMPETLDKDGDVVTLIAFAAHVAGSTQLRGNSKKREAALETCRTLSAAASGAQDGTVPVEEVERALDDHIRTCGENGIDIAVGQGVIEAVMSRWNSRPVSVETVSSARFNS